MRTDLTSEIDAALAGRNAGSNGYWECARSGNGDMTTDLLSEDGTNYEELEGLGESVEEMDSYESAAEDKGNRGVLKPYREPLPSEAPPRAPKPGTAWLRRRIPMQSRRPGGNRLVRLRWVQVSPQKYRELQKSGLVKATVSNTVDGLGFVTLTADLIKGMFIGGGLAFGYYLWKKRGALKV